jgi:hypothetical protein
MITGECLRLAAEPSISYTRGEMSRHTERRASRRITLTAGKYGVWILIGVIPLFAASPARAHHSHAMFDLSKEVTLVGTVKEFQWNNPHCWIQVLVPDPKDPSAPPVEWGVEMGAPIQLIRHGWKPDSLKPGDKITVVVNPLRDGRPGGQIVSAIGPDGKPLGAVPEANGK